MLQWIQGLSWVIAVVNGIRQLFGKSKECAAPEPVVEAAPAVQPKPARKPRRRKPAKPKQQ